MEKVRSRHPAGSRSSLPRLSFDLEKNYSHLDSSYIQPTPDGTYADFNYTPYELGDELIRFKGLQYDGTYTNGISFGNSQSLVVNSNFNLRMAGTLGDDIEILAAISDQNIPLQPEGNTQQLQEFDKIFIQLKRKNSQLIAGDYELARPKSYFMNYFKKLQGATFSNATEFEKGTITNQLSVAVARGKFARNTLVQQEGNQGPYRLSGNEGEAFIIILAGTEKVYLDGQLLKRGLEEDYTIDYNRGDVTFTNRRLITKDSRIIVEFEYNDQNYLRSLMAFNSEWQTEKLRLYFNLYTEQDSKTSGAAADLDSLERRALREAGDRQTPLTSGIDTISEYSPFRVSFKMVDTTYNCGNGEIVEQVLVYTTSEDSARYTASFTLLGPGMGNYDLDSDNAANGRVYVWVAPDPATCQPRGSYEPKIRLIAPEQKQLYTLGAEYQLGKNARVHTEVALSNRDPNRLSNLDESDDQGLAVYSAFNYQKKLGKTESKWLLKTDLAYEFVQDHFTPLNPYRPAEFTRDWNLRQANTTTTDSIQNHQHLLSTSVSIGQADLGKLEYGFGTFLQGSSYTGVRHSPVLELSKNGFRALLRGSHLSSSEGDTESRFFRPTADLSKSFEKIGGWTLGVYGEREKNDRRDTHTDSLNASSFYYDLWRVYLKSQEDKKLSAGVSYGQRYDYAPAGEDFGQNTEATDINVQGHWVPGKASRLNWNLNYRQLHIIDSTLTNLDPQETFLGRLDHQLKLWKGMILSTTNYEIGGGQEPLVEYRYLEVPRGEGLYFWDAENSDFNGDGVPQINEVQEAPFPDQANIVRVTVYTNQFIRTNRTLLNQSLRLEPRVLWHQKKDFRKVLSKFSTQSTLRINRRTREAEGVSPWNPFQVNISDTALVALNYSIQKYPLFQTQQYQVQFSTRPKKPAQPAGAHHRLPKPGRGGTVFQSPLEQKRPVQHRPGNCAGPAGKRFPIVQPAGLRHRLFPAGAFADFPSQQCLPGHRQIQMGRGEKRIAGHRRKSRTARFQPGNDLQQSCGDLPAFQFFLRRCPV